MRCMIEIAVAPKGKGILQKEISRNQNLSRKYLDHIIVSLKSSGIVANSAGRGGGYRLGKNAANISVYDVYQSFEPHLNIVNGVGEDCTANNYCAAREYWQELRNRTYE